jgi:predicted alpha/beta-fold hydrolase
VGTRDATYRAPRWLPGGHLQTLYASLFAPRPRVRMRRERWDTPDGDFIDLDWLPIQHSEGAAPLVVLFHGLEGDSRAQYAQSLMSTVSSAGWQGVVVHFRGCSGEPNRLRRAYHSGDSAEIDWILRRLRSFFVASPVYAVGISLGGNALLKWLGEQGAKARGAITAAAAVSAPVDLMAAGNALDAGFNLIYTRNFLITMKRKTLAKLERFPDLCDRQALAAARTLRQFDNIVTAPLHGYRDTDDYWTRASSKPWLTGIAVPTLVLNARNDPFIPASALPQPHEVASSVHLELPANGGHVGFVAAPFPGRLDWMPTRLLRYFSSGR